MKSPPLARRYWASASKAGSTTMPRWLMLPECMSSRTRPCPITAFANAASPQVNRPGAPTMVAPPALPSTRSASCTACRLQGNSRDSKAQPMRSIRHTFTFSVTSAGRFCADTPTTDRAMRAASGSWASRMTGLFIDRVASGMAVSHGRVDSTFVWRRLVSALSAHFDAGPGLDDFADRGEIRVGAVHGVGDREHLAHGGAADHGHAQRLRLVDAQAHILVRQACGEAEIEGPRQHRFWKFVLRGAVATRSGVEHVEHHLRIESGLDAHDHRLGSQRDGGGGQQVVGELHGLRLTSAFTEMEGLAECLEDGLQFHIDIFRAGHHDRERAFARALESAAHRGVDIDDVALRESLGDQAGGARSDGREIHHALHPGAFDH